MTHSVALEPRLVNFEEAWNLHYVDLKDAMSKYVDVAFVETVVAHNFAHWNTFEYYLNYFSRFRLKKKTETRQIILSCQFESNAP